MVHSTQFECLIHEKNEGSAPTSFPVIEQDLVVPLPKLFLYVRAIPRHPQLKDLIVCPTRAGLLNTACNNHISSFDLHNNTRRALATLSFEASTIVHSSASLTYPQLLGACGQKSEIALMYTPSSDSNFSTRKQSKHALGGYVGNDFGRDRRTNIMCWDDDEGEDEEVEGGYKKGWSMEMNRGMDCINNSLHIGPSPLSQQTHRLLLSTNDKSIIVFDARAPTEPPPFSAPSPSISDEDEMTTLSEQEEYENDSITWDDSEGLKWRLKQTKIIEGFEQPINHASVSPNGRRMVATGDSVNVYLYDVAHNGDYVPTCTQQTHAKTSNFSTSWSPDSMYYAVASQAGFITVWDVRSSKSLAVLHTSQRGAAGAARVVKFCPSSSNMLLAFSEHRNYIHVVDARNFEGGQRLEVPVPYPWVPESPAPQTTRRSQLQRLRRNRSTTGLSTVPSRPPLSRTSSRSPHPASMGPVTTSSQRNYLRLSNSNNSSTVSGPERRRNPVFSWEEDLPLPVQPGQSQLASLTPDPTATTAGGPLAIPRQEIQERDQNRPYNLSAQEGNIPFREYLTQAVYSQAYDLEIFDNQISTLSSNSHPRLTHPMTPFSVLFQNRTLSPTHCFSHPKLEFTSVSRYGPSLSYSSPLPQRPPPFAPTDNVNCPPSHPTDLNGLCWDPSGDYLYCSGGEWGIAEWKVDTFARGTRGASVLC